MDSKKKSALKAITWRITGTLDTFVVSWFVTGSLALSGSIASIEVLTKIVLYYTHERVWANITKE